MTEKPRIYCSRPGCTETAIVSEDEARPGALDGDAVIELVDIGWHLFKGQWLCPDEPSGDPKTMAPRA